jgi:hypothetical protein
VAVGCEWLATMGDTTGHLIGFRIHASCRSLFHDSGHDFPILTQNDYNMNTPII